MICGGREGEVKFTSGNYSLFIFVAYLLVVRMDVVYWVIVSGRTEISQFSSFLLDAVNGRKG